MYQSPIEIVFPEYGNLFKEVQRKNEEEIMTCIQVETGLKIDKEELIRALRYDRDQYEKGFADGQNSIVRCGECKYMLPCGRCTMFADDKIRPSVSDFCSHGERGEAK